MGNEIGCCNTRDGGTDLLEDEEAGVSLQDFENDSEDEDAGAHFSVKHALDLHKSGDSADKNDIQLLLNTKSALKRKEDLNSGLGKRSVRKEDPWHRARELGQKLDMKMKEEEKKNNSPKLEKNKSSKKKKHKRGHKERSPVKKVYVM